MTVGRHTLDQTLHEGNRWLNDLGDKLHTDDRQLAYHALRATLHTVRDQIGPEQAVKLGAQLPTLIRGIFYEGWHLNKPARQNRGDQFLARIKDELPNNPKLSADRAVKATFQLLWDNLDAGEVVKVVEHLPEDLGNDLWPQLGRN